jgi:MoaA/NifB/PqqE/SkfB family radical SAM enzyme
MDAKISVTTKCNAQCKTCPVWQLQGFDMSVKDFKLIWNKLNTSKHINKILLNNTGDMYNHPDRIELFKYLENHRAKYTVMTTNAEKMDYIPAIDELIISFNGGNREGYEYTTGMDYERTCTNIRKHYKEIFNKIKTVEMHCLIWDGNVESEKDILQTWSDFPGRIRISYKYDNQMKEDHTLQDYKREERIYCDYLDKLNIWPNGKIIMCAHDFAGSVSFGNILIEDIEVLMYNSDRKRKRIEHMSGEFTGLCENCNYNTPLWGKVNYVS